MTCESAKFDVFACPLDGINLIEASAGTGKTWNICGIYLRLLLERRLEVRQILVVTFTNAATAELRERVRQRIVEALACLDGAVPATADPFVPNLLAMLDERGVARQETVSRLELALQTFDEASIFTIHGFCERALAETPFTSALPFALELVPDDSDLRMEAVHDFWRRHVAGDGCSPELAAYLARKGDSPKKFAKLLGRHLDRPLARAIWPRDIERPLAADHAALADAYDAARATWRLQRDAVADLLVASLPALNRRTYRRESIRQSALEWDAYFLAADPLASIDPKAKLHLCRASRLRECTRKGKATPSHPFLEQADALVVARAGTERGLGLARLRLIRTLLDEAAAALRRRKRERRVVSYQDLLYDVHAALQGDDYPGLASALRARFPAALIDEFQDTDPLQFAIFDAVFGTGEVPLFLMGDPKQAIYSFRNADLHTYLTARRKATAEYTLADNQRATPGLIAAVNGIFTANERAFLLAGIDFRPARPGARARAPFRDANQPRPDLCVWMLPQREDTVLLERHAARNAAVMATAGEIARLLRDAETGRITLDQRALRPADIAVLVRTRAQGREMRLALRALGIGSVELSQQSVFHTADAEDVESVLLAILEPARTGLLRRALATELMGCDAASVAAISADESALLVRIERFAAYRDTWLREGVGFMFRRLLTAEGVASRMLARADGERRLTNLLHLCERLHYAAATHASPDALLRWLHARRQDEVVDDAMQLRLESDRNLVQIVTIHAAKGLEYGVVFCPFLWDGYPSTRSSGIPGRQYHDARHRAVIDYRDNEELGDEADAISMQIRLEAAAESLRMIYVALTRATHRCYVIAGCYLADHFGRISSNQSTRSLLNWLVAGAGLSPEAWFEGAHSPAAIAGAWTKLAAQLAPHLGCLPLPMEAGTPVAPTQPLPESLCALPPPAHVSDGWRISSFSGLHHGAVSEASTTDHDARSDRDAPVRTPPVGLAADDILRFPRGTSAGDCLHKALERIDFTDPATWEGAIANALSAHPMALPGLPRDEQRPILVRMMARMIADVMGTELPDGIRLDTIPNARRLTELEWSLPSPALTAPALNETLRALGYSAWRFTFPRHTGYLKGFIDVLFERRGRYYVLDWKSNHLGYAAADYATPALAVAMASHGYHLQHLLYSVAVARYLARRVPGYHHDTHFGGVLYLFVRGVRPQWKDAGGAATGVYFHRPSAAALQALDALLTPPSRRADSA